MLQQQIRTFNILFVIYSIIKRESEKRWRYLTKKSIVCGEKMYKKESGQFNAAPFEFISGIHNEVHLIFHQLKQLMNDH